MKYLPCIVTFFLAITLRVPTSAFSVGSTTFVTRKLESPCKLSALIYGWDGDDEDEITSYTDVINDVGGGQCSTEGAAVAESLSQDKDRIGNLARLAVAFSPPEQKISLDILERIEVACVRHDQIEIEAMVCEEGGCVSLSVPVKFPRECGSDSEWLEVCVRENLDSLDLQAESTLRAIEEASTMDNGIDLDELCRLNEKVDFPSWWVPPECNAELVMHCEDVRRLLNEDEYQNEIQALARHGLAFAGEADKYVIRKARVALVGPAGFYLKVAAAYHNNQEDLHFLDVMYPFGGEPMQDADSLRAAVLGAIAAAEDLRPSPTYQAKSQW